MSRNRAVPLSLSFVFLHLLTFGQTSVLRKYERYDNSAAVCGYESCPKADPNKLNVHLVPHTHDDVGWLKTVDQYYFGSRNNVQKAGVQYILDTVIEELVGHPERRFIYVETAFLWKWWQRQNEEVRKNVRDLINEGRLEIIGGGWSMNDEAVTHYRSIVDQFTWGLRRLNDTFGPCARPKIGWQIDPFGHSREQASIFAQMGFDGLLFARLDYQDREKRYREKTSEFVWKGSSSLGDSANLFTTALFNHYGPPPGFCFDILCDDDPIIDDPESPDYNVDQRIKSFVDFTAQQAQRYRTNNIILTMGNDFTYQQAEMWFENMDKLISYANKASSSINVFYSTPSCYLKSLNDLDLTWTTKSDDFFPYASDPHAYWTGYFTSRPTLKFFERQGSNFLQIVKQVSALSSEARDDEQLDKFREAMGVMQHHDAVTGTEKQNVAEDYARILYNSMKSGEDIINNAMRSWISKNPVTTDKEPLPSFLTCLRLTNESSCAYTEGNKQFVVTLYNPQSQPLTAYVRVPVVGRAYVVRDPLGALLPTQVVPIPEAVLEIPGRTSEAKNELVFLATAVPALGFKSFHISEDTLSEATNPPNTSGDINSTKISTVSVDPETGTVRVNWDLAEDMRLEQSFSYYIGEEGNNREAKNRSSGAYIFRPTTTTTQSFSGVKSFKVYQGPLVGEIHVRINDWISEVVRLYGGESQVEFDWLVGPIPVGDKKGKEIVTKYSSNLKSDGEFYTDSNGRETIKRKKNYRPTWDLQLEEPVAGNYYPVTAKIHLEDVKRQLRLAVLTDRAQGGTSMVDGELELMLHRRLLSDDAFGVGEALNEEAFDRGLVARGQHFVLGGKKDSTDDLIEKEKYLALKLGLRQWILLSPTSLSFEDWQSAYHMERSGFTGSLPRNVHILTLEPWSGSSFLLRLEHLFEKGEDPEFSQPAEVDIKDLFADFTITSIRETTLAGNQWLADMNRLNWKIEQNEILRRSTDYKVERVKREDSDDEERKNSGTNGSAETKDDVPLITLEPMQIRTFVIEVRAK